MNKFLNDIKVFYRQYRIWIIGGLFFLIMMQVCSYGAKNHSSIDSQSFQEEMLDHEDLESLTVPPVDQPKERKPLNDNILLLMGAGLLFYFALKRKLFYKIMPSIVWISLSTRRIKSSKVRLARIQVTNKTKESITFEAPVLVFRNLTGKPRRFKLKNGIDDLFPLTLTPNTSHSVNIDIDQFRIKAGIEGNHRWMKVEVEAHNQKVYTSFWIYL